MTTSQADPALRFLRNLTIADPTARLSDRDLLERFLHGREQAAFAALVRRHGQMVLGVCRHVLHEAHDAEDAFQATFLILSQKAASLRPQKSLSAWLHGVAQRVAQKARTAAARRRTHEGRAAARQVADPAAEITLREAHEILDRELARLPAKQREPLVLCYLEGLTRDEAAQRLGWPPGTLKSRLEQGRDRLRARLGSRGLALPAALVATLFCGRAASASVPAGLLDATVKAVCPSVVGAGVIPLVPPRVAALARAVLRGLLLARMKKLAVPLPLTIVLALAVGAATYATLVAGPAPEINVGGAPAGRESSPAWQPGAVLAGHKDEVVCLAFGGDRLATAGKDGAVKLWDASAGKKVGGCAHAPELGPMRCMTFAADGKHVLMILGDQLGFWDTTKDSFPKAPIGGAVPVAVAAGPDKGCVWVLRRADDAKALMTWKVEYMTPVDGKPDVLGFAPFTDDVFVGFRHTTDVRTAALSADRTVLATASVDKSAKLWDTATGKERATCKGLMDVPLALAFAPDGKALASAGKDSAVRVWDVASGKELATLKEHDGPVRCAAFSADGNTLASGGDDGAVRLWDVKAARELTALKGHTGAVLAVAFGRDGKVLASASKDKTVRLWEAKK